MKLETVHGLIERKQKTYFGRIKKAILEIVDALLNMQIKIEDRNIMPVPIIDTG